MATVVKNFKVKNGIVIEGTTGTLNGSNILTEDSAQNISNKTLGSTLDANNNLITNLSAPESNTDAATKLYSDTASTSAAETAVSEAESYTDSLIGDETVDGSSGNTVTDRIGSAVSALVSSSPEALDTLNELAAALGDDPNFASTVSTSLGTKVGKAGDTMTGDLTLAQDPTSNLHAATKQYVDAAETDAKAYTDTRETAITTAYQNYADAAEGYAISTAAADATYKANTAESNAVATASSDATSKANTAESNANTYTDTAVSGINSAVNELDTDDIAEGSNLYFTAARAVAALEAIVPNFTEIDVNSVATQVAAISTAATAGQAVAYFFNSTTYRSAKFIVKVAYGTHTEVSEVLLTLDATNNIAITEYAIVGTNGAASTISAGMSGELVQLLVTTTNDASTITTMGTLLV